MFTVPIRRSSALLASVVLLAALVSTPAAAKVDYSIKFDDYRIKALQWEDEYNYIEVTADLEKRDWRGDGKAPESSISADVEVMVEGRLVSRCHSSDPARLHIAPGNAQLRATFDDCRIGSPVSVDIRWKALKPIEKEHSRSWRPPGANCSEDASHTLFKSWYAYATTTGTVDSQKFEGGGHYDPDKNSIRIGSWKNKVCVPS